MGCCACTEDDVINKEAERQIRQALEKPKEELVQKLLLIGTGGCGKSTLLKNLKRMNGKPVLDEPQKEETTRAIRTSLLELMTRLIMAGHEFELVYRAKDSVHWKDKNEDSMKTVQEYTMLYCKLASCKIGDLNNPGIPGIDVSECDETERQNLGRLVQEIWALGFIQAAFKYRGDRFQMPANMAVFFPRAQEIMAEDYQPSIDDCLNCYARTTGVIHYTYIFDETVFKVVDMGAQRSERLKWRNQFDEDTAALLFLVALNHYNEVLFEDEKVNAMHEAVNVFTEYSNDEALQNASIFLIFTKQDLFEQSLKDFPLSMCFGREIKGWDGPEYWEGPDYALMPGSEESVEDWNERRPELNAVMEASLDFIKEVFKNRYEGKQQVYCYVTHPTSLDEVKEAFWDIQKILIRRDLKECGRLT